MKRHWWLLFCGVALAAVARADTKTFDFGPWAPGTSPQEIGKRIAERFLGSPHVGWGPDGRAVAYQEVCTWYGALTYAKLVGDQNLTRQLVERFEPFLEPANAWRIPPINHVDACVFGALPLEIYLQTQRYPYRVVGLAIADGQWDNPTPEGLTNQTRFWIDDMYMITAVQVQAYRATGERRYLDRAANEMVVYLAKLQQPNGLFFHAPEVPFFWGRGNGWMAAGMTELLRSLPADHPQYPVILAGYRKMMSTLLSNQTAEGMWRQLIDRPEAWAESSCTGMFTFAFITGVKNGWLPAETYGPAARKGWLALIAQINDQNDVREICVGTNKKNDYQYYLDRPRAVGDMHGQAPVLWCASALLR